MKMMLDLAAVLALDWTDSKATASSMWNFVRKDFILPAGECTIDVPIPRKIMPIEGGDQRITLSMNYYLAVRQPDEL